MEDGKVFKGKTEKLSPISNFSGFRTAIWEWKNEADGLYNTFRGI